MSLIRSTAGVALFGLLALAAGALAQPDSIDVAARSPRVALLPFANYAETPVTLPEVMALVRTELLRNDVELVTADAISETLRKYRIRNTNELGVAQIQQVTDDLSAAFLLIGSVDRYVESVQGTEIALTARLLAVPAMSIEWTATSAVHTADGFKPLEIGTIRSPKRVMRRAVRKLLDDFRFERSPRTDHVQEVRLREHDVTHTLPCQQLLVIPFGNETSIHHAGNAVTQRVVAALFREGFSVIEPGRVRESMLANGDVTPGRATADLLKLCGDETGAELVLTGTVSEFEGATSMGFERVPSVAVEARLIDSRDGTVVWARTLRCDGTAGAQLFGTGTVHGLGSVTDQLAARLAKSIPVRKARAT